MAEVVGQQQRRGRSSLVKPLCCVIMTALAPASGLGQSTSDPAPVSLWSIKPAVGELLAVPGTEVPRPQVAASEPPSPSPGGQPLSRRKRVEFVVAPLPVINPTLDNGVAVVLGAIYPLNSRDTRSAPSTTFLMGMKTSNGSGLLAVGQTLHFHEDRYRVLVRGGYADINFDFFGIGSSAGAAGKSIALNQVGYGGMAEILVRAADNLYVGPRYRLTRTTVAADFSQTNVPVPLDDIRLRTALLGPHVEYDTRDNQFAPTRGVLLDGLALFAGQGIGGRRKYETYQGQLSAFVSASPRQVIAGRVNVCGVSEHAPFYDLCLIGQYQDLRGYPSGQYRDRRMITGQAEYRLRVWWRVGLVAFGGVGQIGQTFNELTWDGALPSAGAGFRFRLTKQNPMNLRIDYAWGRRSNALYISVGEAF